MKMNRKALIIALSILIPIVVSILYVLPKDASSGESILMLPKLNALINGTTFIVLLIAFNAIKKGNRKLHKQLMLLAIVLSVLFLVSYVIYHSMAESTSFGGEGVIKYIYFFILISHILLAIVIVPLVLITLNRALSQKFDRHKKIARICLPIWLYVTLSGVIVYLMISPYY